MTWALVTALVAVASLAALLGGLLVYAIPKAFSAKDGQMAAIRELSEAERKLMAALAESQSAGQKATVLASALEQQKETSAHLARRAVLAENHRDGALQKLAEMGDPDGVAASIRAELAELSELSSVPTAAGDAPTAPAHSGRRPGPVPD